METNELAVSAEIGNPTRPMDAPTSAEPITNSGGNGVKCSDKHHLLWIRQMGESLTGRGPNPIGPLFLVEMESFRLALKIEDLPNDVSCGQALDHRCFRQRTIATFSYFNRLTT